MTMPATRVEREGLWQAAVKWGLSLSADAEIFDNLTDQGL
jgi:hypothetical protein